MGRLLIKPDGPGTAFLKAAGGTALAVGVPLVLRVTFLAKGGSMLAGLGFSLMMSLGFSITAGVIWALRSLVLLWAYNKVADG